MRSSKDQSRLNFCIALVVYGVLPFRSKVGRADTEDTITEDLPLFTGVSTPARRVQFRSSFGSSLA